MSNRVSMSGAGLVLALLGSGVAQAQALDGSGVEPKPRWPNAALAAQPDQAKGALSEPLPANFRACGAVQDGGFTTTSATYELVRSCVINAPEAGFVLIHASTSLGVATGGNYEARFTLSIDGETSASFDRWINAYTDATDGTDKNVAISALLPVAAGPRTLGFSVSRYNGAGTVQLYDPQVQVVFVPASATRVRTCGASGNTVWNTAETSFQEIRSCTLTVPERSTAFLLASASAGLASGGAPYEGRFRLGVDTVSGTAAADRWVNVTTDAGDGTDEAVHAQFAANVEAGAHTFYFSGARYNGTGPLQLYDPTLAVITIPNAYNDAFCAAGGSDTYTNATTSYTTIRACTRNASDRSTALLFGSASVGLNDTGAGNDFEMQARLGIDNDSGSSISDRWVNVYTDATDGTDRPYVNGLISQVQPGLHTYYSVARRYAGTGTIRQYSPHLAVLIVPFPPLFSNGFE